MTTTAASVSVKPKNGGQFAPGNKASPGRPKAITADELRGIARRAAPEMVRTLIDIATDSEMAPAARVSAANYVLDRGYGKAPVMMADEDGNAVSWVEVIAQARARIMGQPRMITLDGVLASDSDRMLVNGD